jgi:23S rRNA pseudouridine955/2504/2580 synthase
MTKQIHITGNDDGQRLDKFLRKQFPQFPLSVIYKFLRQKKVRLYRNDKKSHGKRDDILKKGDGLKLYFDPDAFGEKPEKRVPNFEFLINSGFFKENFTIHFEDEYLFIAEKPAGIPVHPGSKTPWGQSLIDLFIAHVRSANPDLPEPKLLHRLDKETSGLLIISKNDATLRKLTKLLISGQIEKKYLTLVKGKLSQKSGEINADLIRTEGSKYIKIRVSRSSHAQKSRTLYTVKKYFPELDASLVEVTLDTGRMHQIRVHFENEGHPLAGDDAYGDFVWNKQLREKYGLRRHFLHAYQLSFTHPETEEKMVFISQLPPELKKILPSK